MLKMMPPDHNTLDQYLLGTSSTVKQVEEEEICETMAPPLNGLRSIELNTSSDTPHNNTSSADLTECNVMFNNYSDPPLLESSTILLNPSTNTLDDSETESVETNTGEDDPNDPEWKGEAQ